MSQALLSPAASSFPPPAVSCHLCTIVQHHKLEVQNILKKAMKRPKLTPNFRNIPIVSVPSPGGSVDLSISDIENRYKDDHPSWAEGSECFPAGPLYFDKLSKTKPYNTAKDLEIKLEEAKENMQNIENVIFDPFHLDEASLIKNCCKIIIRSFKNSIKELLLSDKKILEIEKILENRLKGKTNELREQTKLLETLRDLQRGVLDIVVEKSCCWSNYSERIGLMGELSCLRSVHKAMENTPSILVHSYRPSKELAQPLRKINILINPKNAAEHDLEYCLWMVRPLSFCLVR